MNPRVTLPWRTLIGLWITVVGIAGLMVRLYWPALAHALALEDSPVVWLQTSMLVAAAVLTLVLGHQQSKRHWFFVAVALVLMALDERFMGHERLKEWLLYTVYDGSRDAMGWRGDAPLAIYLAGGIAVLGATWWALDMAPRVFLLGAVVVGGVAIGLDILDLRIAWQIVEELLELLAETLFVSGLIAQTCAETQRLRRLPQVQEDAL